MDVFAHIRPSASAPALPRERALPSERMSLMARLEVAQRKAKLGQDQIDSQQKLIATLFANGSEGEEFAEAENRLRVYQKLQKGYVADVERIADALQHTFL